MGEIGLEMEYENRRAMQDDIGEARARLEKEMGYPQEAMSQRRDTEGPRHRVLIDRIQQSQNMINEVISNLGSQLEFVRDMREDGSPMVSPPTAADEPNCSSLEETLDEIGRENMRIHRRLTDLRDNIRL